VTNIGNRNFIMDSLVTALWEAVADVTVNVAPNVKVIVTLKVVVTFTWLYLPFYNFWHLSRCVLLNTSCGEIN